MPPRQPKPIESLPQAPETWAAGNVQLRMWITPEDEPPYRPYLLVVVDLDHGYLLASDTLAAPATAADMSAALQKAMRKPERGGGKPRRPAAVILDDAALAEALAAEIARWGLGRSVGPLPMLAGLARELESHLNDGPEPPGLLAAAGVTPALAGAFFSAAAGFYRAAPWVRLEDRHALAVRIPAEGGDERVVSVLGNAGVQEGLAVYADWATLERLLLGAGPDELLRAHGSLALWFGDVTEVPFDDLDALQAHGWEIAGENAYPIPVRLAPGDQTVRPGADDLRWLEGALRAIPLIVSANLRPAGRGEFAPFTASVAVPTLAGPVRVAARFPAGVVDISRRDPRPPEWPPGAEDDEPVLDFDRRAMERQMARLTAGLGEAPAANNPKLEKAQKLMYRAWEETNPAKRLSLAHKALATSPDCADAYVLLAEEEADSLARAAELYRQGVAAGERALGADYLREYRGHFWGLLETRPYMRARAGLANTLWSLGQPAEAAAEYRALLELNPNDNQGARSSLLDLLLDMGDDDGAVGLLRQYKEEASAEWLYTGALVLFRRRGAGGKADRRLGKALQQNKFVPAYLLGQKRLPARRPTLMGWGDEAEAQEYAGRYLNLWRRTPGALDWLKQVMAK